MWLVAGADREVADSRTWVAATGSGAGGCDPLSWGGWIRAEQAGSDLGRAHGGQVRAEEGLTGKFRFNLVATNGQVIATSEAYESKASAIKASSR